MVVSEPDSADLPGHKFPGPGVQPQPSWVPVAWLQSGAAIYHDAANRNTRKTRNARDCRNYSRNTRNNSRDSARHMDEGAPEPQRADGTGAPGAGEPAGGAAESGIVGIRGGVRAGQRVRGEERIGASSSTRPGRRTTA